MNPLVMIIIGSVVLGLIAALFWPRKGLIARIRQARRFNGRVLQEDALKYLYKARQGEYKPDLHSLAGALSISPDAAAELLVDLESNELILMENEHPILTPKGREVALHIIRAHRLWERYLSEETGYGAEEWHALAETLEHNLSVEALDDLANQLGNPSYDPHGDPIPTAHGELGKVESLPLTSLEPGTTAQIMHLEDEPEMVADQLRAERLAVGQLVQVLEGDNQRIRFWAGGDEHVLAPMVAAYVSVRPVPEVQHEPEAHTALSEIKAGYKVKVTGLSNRVRGAERRRLMDLGILPGTEILVEMVGTGGSPVAYRIRGALIALRKRQSDFIYVKEVEVDTPQGVPAKA